MDGSAKETKMKSKNIFEVIWEMLLPSHMTHVQKIQLDQQKKKPKI